MNRFKKFFTPLVLVLTLLAIGAAVAFAQARDSFGRLIRYDHREREITSTIPVTASATAAIVTAVAGKQVVAKALVLHSTAAGLFSFHDGSGGANLGSFYLEANKPFQVPESNLGVGMKTTAGNALHASGTASAALTITGRVWFK